MIETRDKEKVSDRRYCSYTRINIESDEKKNRPTYCDVVEIQFNEIVSDRGLCSGTKFDIESSNSRGLGDSEIRLRYDLKRR